MEEQGNWQSSRKTEEQSKSASFQLAQKPVDEWLRIHQKISFMVEKHSM